MYRAREKLSRLEDTHVILAVRTGPDLQGFPMKRTRTLASGVNRAMLVWCGPDPHLVEEDFRQKFHRQLTLTGSAYLDASEDEIFDYACSLRGSLRKESACRNLISEGNPHDIFHVSQSAARAVRLAPFLKNK